MVEQKKAAIEQKLQSQFPDDVVALVLSRISLDWEPRPKGGGDWYIWLDGVRHNSVPKLAAAVAAKAERWQTLGRLIGLVSNYVANGLSEVGRKQRGCKSTPPEQNGLS